MVFLLQQPRLVLAGDYRAKKCILYDAARMKEGNRRRIFIEGEKKEMVGERKKKERKGGRKR